MPGLQNLGLQHPGNNSITFFFPVSKYRFASGTPAKNQQKKIAWSKFTAGPLMQTDVARKAYFCSSHPIQSPLKPHSPSISDFTVITIIAVGRKKKAYGKESLRTHFLEFLCGFWVWSPHHQQLSYFYSFFVYWIKISTHPDYLHRRR